MREVTAKDLLDDQKKRFLHLKQKEQDNSTTEDAKANFRRAPYMGMYQGQNKDQRRKNENRSKTHKADQQGFDGGINENTCGM